MRASSESVSVLHVDDDRDFADTVAIHLERADDRFTVETAASADQGLERLAEAGFDCVVSDYDMPNRNGIEFLERLREEYPDLPFILFTGEGSEAVASDAISAGATDYLQKGRGTERYDLLANRIRNAVEQYRATERAAEYDRIRTLASEINKALVRADSRAEVETRVCEIISSSDPYRFAWIGEPVPGTDRVEPRAAAGVNRGYLDEITVTTDESSTGLGPGGTAIRDRCVAVSQNVGEDPEFEPWREEALERGYRSVAAVPLEYGETLYGELVVYAERPDAFDEKERALLADLGDDLAHAFHSFDVRDRLRRERDRRRALFANAPVPVVEGEVHEGGAEHRIVDVNDTFEDVFGYASGTVVGEDIADVVLPEGAGDRHGTFRERTTAGEATVTEVERRTADGTREFLLTIVPYGTADDPAEGWYAWYTDVSERRARERAIEELHSTTDVLLDAESTEAVTGTAVEAVRDVLDMPANVIHLYDESEHRLRPVAYTDEAEELVGEVPAFEPGESLAWEVFETGDARVYDDVSTVPGRHNPETDVRSEIIVPIEGRGVLLAGSDIPDAFDGTDVSLAQTLAAHVTTALERIERADERRRQRELFEAILETSIDGILVVDENREYVTWNQQFVDMWGIPEELIGGEPEAMGLEWVLDRLAEPEAFIEKVEYLYEHPGEESRDRIRLTDGRVFDRYSAPVTADEGTHFGRVWFFRDITDRERRERELARQAERLEAFATAFPDLAFILDEEGRYRDALAGDERDDLLYDDGASLRDGRLHEVFRDERADRFLSTIRDVIDTGDERTIEYELDVPAGERVFEARIAPLSYELDGRGAVVWVARDVTERRERERELERKTERLHEFASTLSHDLRNPLNVAQGRIELARDECESDHLDDAAAAVDRSLALISELLTLAREGDETGDVEAVDLAETVEACWQNVETGGMRLVTETDRTIRANPSRLKQLLENLMRNSVEHGSTSGRTGSDDGVEHGFAGSRPGADDAVARDGAPLTVTVGDLDDGFYVADDGPGIPESERERVFDAGYSTVDGGTGFGLSIVRQIADDHGWTVSVTEGEAGGARFEIAGVETGR